MDNEQTYNITLTNTELGWVAIALWDGATYNEDKGWHFIAKVMRELADRMGNLRTAQDLDRV